MNKFGKAGIILLHLLSRPNSSGKENFNFLQLARLGELQKPCRDLNKLKINCIIL